MYARRLAGKSLTFDFAEGLLNNNLLIVDRETHSVWSQLDGKAISGPLKGTPLQVLPSMQTTWKFWKNMHPDTQVMMVQDSEGHPYWYRNWQPGSRPPLNRPNSHDVSALGLGLAFGNQALFLPFRELEKAKLPLRLELGAEKIVIQYRAEALTAWAEDEGGNLLPGVLSYQKGWLDFHPESLIFHAE